MRVISVVIGEKTSGERFDDVRTMFDYAFANYTVTPIFQAEQPLDEKVHLNGGEKETIEVYPQRDVSVFTKRGEKPKLTFEKRMEYASFGEDASGSTVFVNSNTLSLISSFIF